MVTLLCAMLLWQFELKRNMVCLKVPNVTALYNNLKQLASVSILISRGGKIFIPFDIFHKFTDPPKRK